MSLNPFSVRHLRPEVDLMYLSAHAQTLLSCLKHMALDRVRVRLNVTLLFVAFSDFVPQQ